MSEFELQQLIMTTRSEFDGPTFVFILISITLMIFSAVKRGALTPLTVYSLQIVYLVVSAFLFIRAFAAIVRLRKLSYLLLERAPEFEYWNIALQRPTFILRNALFIGLIVITLFLLHQCRQKVVDKP